MRYAEADADADEKVILDFSNMNTCFLYTLHSGEVSAVYNQRMFGWELSAKNGIRMGYSRG